MFAEGVIVDLTQNYDKWKVVLAEPQERDSAVEVFNVPAESIVIRADSFPVPKEFFRGNKSELKRADYIIITQYRGKLYSLFIEMKRGSKSEKSIVNQLKGALCLYEYVKEVGRVFWEESNFLEEHNKLFISLSKTSISKKPTRGQKNSKTDKYHDTPENLLKLSGYKRLQFKSLIYKPG